LDEERKTMRVTYFILAPDSKRVKIGTTIKDPEERLSNMQTGSPEKLEVVLVLEHRPPFEERQIHVRFDKYRIHGEWFEYRDALEAFILRKQIHPMAEPADDEALFIPRFEGDTPEKQNPIIPNGALWKEGRVERAFRACADGRDGYPYPFIEGYPSQKGLAYAFRHPTGD
jgi:hypothetical protein